MNDSFIFETKHFMVRPSIVDDVRGFAGFWNDFEVMKFIGDGTWGGGEDIVAKFLNKSISLYESHPGLGSWTLINKSTREIAGECSLGALTKTGEIEAGYILSKAYWGRGLGTELLKGLLEYGFSKLGLSQIVAVVHPGNAASIRVMEKCCLIFVDTVINDGVWVSKYSIAAPSAPA